ncbi:succinate CoA transferase [Pyramidobacter piscolens W5455]|uniref:Succinate CoA transferase n=1 Tax=Pyramidobacter piscolens W5455 TaxID=352165 RepID=A0ABM9ZY70_9BACT|nr:succinate CoA transferase [Pyramidobacter piscolens W5455]
MPEEFFSRGPPPRRKEGRNVYNRISNHEAEAKTMSAAQAAELIKDGMTVGTSGFTMAGYPKAVPMALARRAERGEKIRIKLITGASVGDELDGRLARAGVIERRYPYQTNQSVRELANDDRLAYVDMHLSQVPFWIKNGYFGKIDIAIIEAIGIDDEGNIIPSTSVGCSNVLAEYAEKVIVEVNTAQPVKLEGMHDVYSPRRMKETEPIPIVRPNNRVGMPYIRCRPDKIAAVVVTDIPDSTRHLAQTDARSQIMADYLVAFLENEVACGRLPRKLPPIQSGVGNMANAVLGGLQKSKFRNLSIYSEVLQDSVLDLIETERVSFASGTALTISPERIDAFYKSLEMYKYKIILRPVEISNSPEVIRRLGVIAVNTALEVDLEGNVNSTHIGGCQIVNGLGGSGDFARNAALSVFTTPSTAKNGTISCIVPHVAHVDHTEHDPHVIITEQGCADLRGLTAYERARALIENCAHPKFRPALQAFVERSAARPGFRHGFAPEDPQRWMRDYRPEENESEKGND